LTELDRKLEEILSLTDYHGYDIVGLSVAEPSHLIAALCIAKKIKEKTNTKIVIGGRISISASLLKYPFVDYVICGDGETAFLKLVQFLEGSANIESVPGLAYEQNSVKQNPMKQTDLNNLPPPDFDSLPLSLYRCDPFETVDPYYDTYSTTFPFDTKQKVLVLPYYLSKGCSFSCSFCSQSAHKNREVLYKEPKKIKKDLTTMKQKYKTKYFFFMDSTVNCNQTWLEQVCEEIKGLGILWSDSAVPISFKKGLLQKMRDSGCVRLTWGVESLSHNILKKMTKGFNTRIALKTLKESHEAGIWNYTNWIAGFPHESEKELNETLNAIKNNCEYVDDYTVTGFILQESDIYNNPKKYGIKIGAKKSYVDSAKDRMETDSFDEIGGLTWAEKQKQIENFRQKMVNTLEHCKNLPLLLPMHSLFYLYDKFDNKEDIKKWVRQVSS